MTNVNSVNFSKLSVLYLQRLLLETKCSDLHMTDEKVMMQCTLTLLMEKEKNEGKGRDDDCCPG